MSKKHYPLILIFCLLLFLTISLTSTSDDKTEYYREKLKEKIEAQLASPPKVALSALRQSTKDKTTISGKCTNTSDATLTELIINGMLITDKGEIGSHYQVIDIFEEQKVNIPSLATGESRTFTFQLTGLNWSAAKVKAVIFVQETHTPQREIYQAVLVK